ncbi:MAG: hypothetical protein QGI29_06580, partial [Pirellulales bacterium]|nr:hypothetical protein [Pirellulales bacterium]
PINVVLGPGENLGGLGEGLFVDVAQGYDVFISDGPKVRPAPSSCANDGDVEFVARSLGTGQSAAWKNAQPGPRHRRGLDELSPGNGLGGCGCLGQRGHDRTIAVRVPVFKAF